MTIGTAAEGSATSLDEAGRDPVVGGERSTPLATGPRRKVVVACGVVAVALLLAVVMSLPASLHVLTWIIGTGSDPKQNIWNVAWVRGWMEGHHGLYFTHQLLEPEGANLAWMTLALPSSMFAALLVGPLGLVGAYNVALLVTLAADGVAMYVLARQVGISPFGACFAGLAFESGPYLAHQLALHLDMVGAYPIPLFLAVLWGILEHERPALWRFVLLGALLALAAYDVPDYALYACLAGVVVVLFHPTVHGRLLVSVLESWWGWLLSGLVGLVLVLPLLQGLLFGQLAVGSATEAVNSTLVFVDLAGFFIPPSTGIFGLLGMPLHLQVTYAFPGFLVVAALAVLLSASEKLRARDRGLLRLCLIAAASFGVLSLGTHLDVDGWSLPLPLPFLVLAHLPGFADTLPGRLTVLVAVFSSLAVGLAAALLLRELRGSPAAGSVTGGVGPTARLKVAGATLVALFFFGLSVPYPFPSIKPVDVGFAGPVRQRGGAVLFVPAEIAWTVDWGRKTGYWYMYADAVVGLPTPDGYVSRIPPVTTSRIDASRTLSYVTLMQSTNPAQRTPAELEAARALPGFLRRMNVHSVVFDRSELVHPGADAAWFAAHAGAPTRLHRFPGGMWVLAIQRASG